MVLNRRLWSQLGVALALVFIIVFSFVSPHLAPFMTKETPGFVFEDVRVTQFDRTTQTFQLTAKTAQVSRDNTRLTMSKINGHYFKGTASVFDISAPTADLQTQDGILHFYDSDSELQLPDVRVHIRTDDLVWQTQAQTIEGSGNVQITSPVMRIHGGAFSARIPPQKLRLMGNPRVDVHYD
ncbi:MAG: LPS export ABC transporter periplasmic protein LptC [Candidatus Margulisiibacteriota bacterium]